MFVLNFYKTLTFLSCFLLFFMFCEEKDIKGEQNYIFNPIFNRGGLRNPNWAFELTCPQVGKVLNFKPRINNLNFNQITGG